MQCESMCARAPVPLAPSQNSEFWSIDLVKKGAVPHSASRGSSNSGCPLSWLASWLATRLASSLLSTEQSSMNQGPTAVRWDSALPGSMKLGIDASRSVRTRLTDLRALGSGEWSCSRVAQ